MATELPVRNNDPKLRERAVKEGMTFSADHKDFLIDLGYTFFDVPPHEGLVDMIRILKDLSLWDMGDGWNIERDEKQVGYVRDIVTQEPSPGRTIAFRPLDLIKRRISEADLKTRLEKKGTILSTQMGDSKVIGFELPTQAEALFLIDTMPDDLRFDLLSGLSFTMPTANVFSVTLSDMGISEAVVHPRKRSQYTFPFRTVLTDINVPQRSLRVGAIDGRLGAVLQTGALPILAYRPKESLPIEK